MVRKKFIVGITTVGLMASLAGCAPKEDIKASVEQSGVQTEAVDTSEENITEEVTSNIVEVESIDRYENIRINDWIDEESIIMTRDNNDYEVISNRTGDYYPKNLYTFNLVTEGDELLIGNNIHVTNASISSDGKHIFYISCIGGFGTGFIADIDGNNKIQVTDSDEIFIYEGTWLDDDNVIFAGRGRIAIANVDGSTTDALIDKNSLELGTPVKIDSKLYYYRNQSDVRQLVSYDLDSKEEKVIADETNDIVVSPDNTHMAALITKDGKTQLIVLDNEGNQTYAFMTSEQIYGVNWSPDGSKIAYSCSTDQEYKGLYISDIGTGETTLVSSDLDLITDKVKWSPSGKKLGVSTTETIEGKTEFITHIITLK